MYVFSGTANFSSLCKADVRGTGTQYSTGSNRKTCGLSEFAEDFLHARMSQRTIIAHISLFLSADIGWS